MTHRKIVAIITDVLNKQVIVTADELDLHASKHFPNIPRDMLIELIERILKDPLVIYEELKTRQFIQRERQFAKNINVSRR